MKVERAKVARRRNAADTAASRASEGHNEPDDQETSGIELFFVIAAGLLVALFEALDIDVLFGLILMPVRLRASYRVTLSN